MRRSKLAGACVGPDSDPDRFRIEREAARGAEGRLLRGSITVEGLTLDVAIKQLLPQRTPVEAWHERWSRQVELLRTLQGPGVVPVREGFAGALPHPAGSPGTGRTLYLVMNWVDGESLDEWVKKHPHEDPVTTVERLLVVASALDDMHAGKTTSGKAVLHRDIKPSNILVNDTLAVLVDFGLIRALPDGPRMTELAGTLGYIAPECFEHQIYEPATDRYGFGAVAYYVFTHEEPPIGYDQAGLRTALAKVPALARKPRAVDHLMELLDPDPSARPDSLRTWVEELRGTMGAPSTQPPPTPPAGKSLGQRAKNLRTELFNLAEAHFLLEGDPDFTVVRTHVDGNSMAPPAARDVPAALGRFWERYTVAKRLVDELDAALTAGRPDEAERLLGPDALTLVDGRKSADALWGDMRAQFRDLEATVRRLAVSVREQLSALDARRKAVFDMHHRASQIGAAEDPEVTAVLAALARAETDCVKNPWAGDLTESLDSALIAVTAHVEDLEARHATLTCRLAEAGVQLEQISLSCAAGARAHREAVEKVSNPIGLKDPLDPACVEGEDGADDALRPWLARIEQVAAGGDWRAADEDLRRWKAVADRRLDQATQIFDANRAPRFERDLLRGRLKAVRAMAAATGKSELPKLTRLYGEARDALYVAPCDLPSAQRKVHDYLDAVNEPPPETESVDDEEER